MPRSNRLPAYRRHKASGQAVVTLPKSGGGRHDVYLGPWNSPESKAEYARILAELQRHPLGALPAGHPRPDLTVSELLLGYWKHAEGIYRTLDGKPTSALDGCRLSLRPVRELYGATPAASFGPVALKVVRDVYVKAGLTRSEVNRRTQRVKAVFKWATAEQLIPATVLVALQAVEGLRKGRTTAPDRPPVRPVDEAVVASTLPFLSPAVAGMVELQRLTGMRPGEVCRLRPADIDTSGAVWVFTPPQHKTDHLGKDRAVAIGPKAQQILARFNPPGPTDYYFSPARAEADRLAARAAARQTPRWPSHLRRNAAKRVRHRKRPPAGQYSTHAYYLAVARGCEKAGVGHWAPNRLRHSHATEVRKQFGLEAAQVVLGHAKASVTQLYAERDSTLAAKVALAVG